MKNSYSILEDLISNSKTIDGIVAYSLLMMPESKILRTKILKKIINKKKIICFAVEDLIVKNLKDIKKINDLWQIKQALKNSYKGK